jgi:hypothetical protein
MLRLGGCPVHTRTAIFWSEDLVRQYWRRFLDGSCRFKVDHAIAEALRQRKPVYISVSCNLPGLAYPTFDEVPVPFAMAPKLSNPR